MVAKNTITITVTHMEKGGKLHKYFNCGGCRASAACAGLGQCRLIGYLKTNKFLAENASNMQISAENAKAQVNIHMTGSKFNQTVSIVDRAIRLRSHRYNVRNCK